jgi:hypothetical protein
MFIEITSAAYKDTVLINKNNIDRIVKRADGRADIWSVRTASRSECTTTLETYDEVKKLLGQ